MLAPQHLEAARNVSRRVEHSQDHGRTGKAVTNPIPPSRDPGLPRAANLRIRTGRRQSVLWRAGDPILSLVQRPIQVPNRLKPTLTLIMNTECINLPLRPSAIPNVLWPGRVGRLPLKLGLHLPHAIPDALPHRPAIHNASCSHVRPALL